MGCIKSISTAQGLPGAPIRNMSSSTFSLSLRKVPVVETPKTSPHNLERPALFREPMATCCRPRTRKGRGVGGVVERGRADEAVMLLLGRRPGRRRVVGGSRRRQRPTGCDNIAGGENL